jgi:hypothetical protein
MSKQAKKKKEKDLLVGVWRPVDPFSDIEVRIARKGNRYVVSAVDTDDDQAAKVYDLSYDGESLHFSLYWSSTGRFAKYQFRLVEENMMGVTFTYTSQEYWQRRTTE